jgi:mannose-6-phosphate isomerase-like protein (cupin superfamily)
MPEPMPETPPMSLESLVPEARATPQGYLEFHRVATMSLGVYVLGVGADDSQSPHAEDEVYYVARGRARFRQHEDEEVPVGPGDVLFVPAGVPHRFVAIEEELHLLVVFAPPEGSAGVRKPVDW